MMEERSAFDILLDYPKRHGLDFSFNNTDRHFTLAPSDPWANKKYIVIKKGDLFFLAYDSFSTRFGGSHTQTGVYQTIKLGEDFDISIHPKDWTDFILTSHKIKTDSEYVNSKLTISSRNQKFPLYLFPKKVVDRFLEISDQLKPLKLLIKFDEITMIPELKGKTIVGLETNRWVYENKDLDILINNGGELLKLITARA